MSTSSKFSHYTRFKKRQIDDRDSWIVGWDFLALFFGGTFAAYMTTTMFREVQPDIVDIAVFQMLMAFGGMIFGVVATIKSKGGIGISVRPPSREDIEKTLPYIVGGFAVLAVVNRVITMSGLSGFLLDSFIGGVSLSTWDFSAAMNIGLTAAIAEEAVFSFGFTTFFFKIIEYLTSNVFGKNVVQQNISVGMAAIAVSIWFFLIHIGVYGTVLQIALMLFVNRFVYAIVYMKTRNLAVPTVLHIIHNAMTFL